MFQIAIFQIIISKITLLTYRGPLHNGSIVCSGENGGVVIDICHLDDKVSRVLDHLVVPIVHPGSQMVCTLLFSVQSSVDKQVSFVIHCEDGVCSFAFYFKPLHLHSLT